MTGYLNCTCWNDEMSTLTRNYIASRLVSYNVYSAAGRTTIRLEPEIWQAFREICSRESLTAANLVQKVDEAREAGGRTSGIRIFVFNYFRSAATEPGHAAVGHGRLKTVDPD